MKTIRPFCADDCRLLLSWRNHPEARRWSFDSHTIEPGEHEAWFRDFLADPRRVGLMLIDDGLPVAQIRLEPASHPGILTISIATSPDQFRKGYARELLGQAMHHPEVTQRAVMVRAETFTEHEGSMKVFESAGFKLLGHGTRHGHEYVEWRLPISPVFTQYPFGLEGEGPLLAAAQEMLEKFEIAPRFTLRTERLSRESAGSGMLTASSPLSVQLQDQALATGARALFVFDWPERIPTELLAHFQDGIYVLRRATSSAGAYLELQTGLCESYGVTTATVGGLLLDFLCGLVQPRRG